MSARRFTDKPDLDPESVWSLPDSHPAMTGNRTLFPSTVVEVTAKAPDRILVSAKNNRKIGSTIEKGRFKGYGIYCLSLEERATCPVDCSVRAFCFGNGMQMARRHRIGDADIFYDRLGFEIVEMLDVEPVGLSIRLHVLGDFPSTEYVAFWKEILDEHPNVMCWGYTHRMTTAWGGDEIGDAIQAVKDAYPARFSIRWSGEVSRPDGAVVISKVPKRPRVEEGLVCPAQTDATACCASCALCWEAPHESIAFVKHGPRSGEVAAENAMKAASRTTDFEKAVVAAMPKAKAYALSLCRDGTLAEDLVQEAATKALANRDKFDMGTNFDAWFTTILKNHFLSIARKSGREIGDSDGEITSHFASAEDPEAYLEAKQQMARVDQLPEAQRQAVKAIGEGKSYEDVGKEQGVSPGTIKSRVSRARDTLEDPTMLQPERVRETRAVAAISLPSKLKPAAVEIKTPEIFVVRPEELVIEAAYQRDLSGKSIKLIRHIVANWNWAKFKPPIVADDDGTLLVIDGQHTAIAAATHPDIRQIPVFKVPAQTVELRADSFVAHNRDRLAMSPLQVFHAECAAGDTAALAILRIAIEQGCTIPRSVPPKGTAKPGQATAISALQRIFKANGGDVLARVLRICVKANYYPVTSTIAYGLQYIVATKPFEETAKLPDEDIAGAIRDTLDIEREAQRFASESGQNRYRACAHLIDAACW